VIIFAGQFPRQQDMVVEDDEPVLRKEDELSVPAQEPADDKEVRWRSPASAAGGEGGVSTAAETAGE
jgi:hypothetical protein